MSNNSDDPNDNENAADSAQLTPNPRAMRAMLNWLFDGAPKGSKIEIAHGHPEVGPNTSRQFDVKDIDAVVAYAVEQNFHGHNCYVGAALRKPDTPEKVRASTNHFLIASAMRVDADTNAEAVRASATAIAPIGMIVTSGTTPELRQQLWTRLDVPCGDAALYASATKSYVEQVGGDKSATGAAGIMRLGGTVSYPPARKQQRGYVNELTKVHIIADALAVRIDTFLGNSGTSEGDLIDALARPTTNRQAVNGNTFAGVGPIPTFLLPDAPAIYPSAPTSSISERAVGAVQRPSSASESAFDELPQMEQPEDRLRAMLEATRIQGQWHNNMLSVTASLVARGSSDDAITALCAPYCNDGASDPDLLVMIDGARRKGWAPQPPGLDQSKATAVDRGFKLVRVSDLEYREPEFIIEGLIESQSLAQLFGDSGSGKSFLALDLAACVASGVAFHDHPVRQGAVVYIAGEGHNGLRRRLSAWEKHREVSLNEAPLFISKAAAQFLDLASAQAVEKSVDEVVATVGSPSLIVVDTLARNFGPGDENATKDMSAFVAAIDRLKDRYNCTAILVHHTGHSDKDRGRGSAALKAALDAEYRVQKDGDIISVTATKMKDAAPPPTMSFRLETVELGIDADGVVITSAALVKEDIQAQRQKRRLTDNERLGISAFRCAAELSGKLDADGNFAGLHLDDWRTAFYQMSTADSSGSKRKAFNRTRKDLVTHGEMSVKDDVYMLTGEFFAIDHKSFAESLRKAEQARLAEAPPDIAAVTKSESEDAERDAGQSGTRVSRPVRCPARRRCFEEKKAAREEVDRFSDEP